MNATELAQHYRDIFSRTRPTQKTVVTIDRSTPLSDEKRPPQKPVFAPLPDPRVVPRESKRLITRELFMKWFLETNQEQLVVVTMTAEARRITQPVLNRHGLTMEQAFSRARADFVVDCRHEVWFALAANGYEYAQIGRMFKRDHTTIIHGVRKWRKKSGRQYSDYITNPSNVARRLSIRCNNLAKSEARLELEQHLARTGAVAAGSDGADQHEAGEDHVGQQL